MRKYFFLNNLKSHRFFSRKKGPIIAISFHISQPDTHLPNWKKYVLSYSIISPMEVHTYYSQWKPKKIFLKGGKVAIYFLYWEETLFVQKTAVMALILQD